jgi:hypothetical protein
VCLNTVWESHILHIRAYSGMMACASFSAAEQARVVGSLVAPRVGPCDTAVKRKYERDDYEESGRRRQESRGIRKSSQEEEKRT